ncbi:HISTIDYL-TRNA SYNTHETASE (HISTIDINE--TRNA LIGASE) (HISRS)h) [Mycoplasmopsis pulmonis]|uniref:Histidine--tRNA ligase n=1 Tax=Mycoplasmopsis pulmonis (strain UAB CTIP) TaxID=272635 RepID=SYH_MYCPU|nr:histidine--tRNA ligase [Mycoplasmopsis pulmonis]Q98QM8.1 RecName: Full=Histidine--tRNA ligase; AltName: Full=Histidyl-tRNA synthetase; Short=HisRS [Mycoplasmopsis pulmonis UAB CTIP]MDZ7293292.1 histidine--tRNA ligase [Mycoplasmopsis pulmonis]CAC13506.1 HISTIDYL-TRNA SYNTHETASE (HISTIDINE--TRNA LIGASE) (HISRS)h) [Mycoplasmopsis pulmonis]VEU68097.1 histidyl-tRNA synthetase [Mycoplasmopsis pulmonis]
MKFQKLKGTRDYYFQDSNKLEIIRNAFFTSAKKFNFSFLETPIIENVELFKRTSGDFSDLVKKELYSFEDKSKRQIALRPEGTAPALRAIVENNLLQKHNKFFYFGPMFRYENPQKGRQRQFFSGGIEWLEKQSPFTNIEIIFFAKNFLDTLKIDDYEIVINWIGHPEQRKNYLDHLKNYLNQFENQLEEISKERLKNNALRILDDKIESQKAFVKNAPKIHDFLPKESLENFYQLQDLFKKFDIKFKVDPFLVRGLDYYSDFVFEFVSTNQNLGAQKTLLGGGVYSSLLKELGGENIEGIGFGFGLERIMEVIDLNNFKDDAKKITAFASNEDDLIALLKLRNNFGDLIKIDCINKVVNFKKIFKSKQIKESDFLIFKELNNAQNEVSLKNKFNDQKLVVDLINPNIENIKKYIKENSD